jgi:hypothetical protein
MKRKKERGKTMAHLGLKVKEFFLKAKVDPKRCTSSKY